MDDGPHNEVLMMPLSHMAVWWHVDILDVLRSPHTWCWKPLMWHFIQAWNKLVCERKNYCVDIKQSLLHKYSKKIFRIKKNWIKIGWLKYIYMKISISNSRSLHFDVWHKWKLSSEIRPAYWGKFLSISWSIFLVLLLCLWFSHLTEAEFGWRRGQPQAWFIRSS